MTGIDELFTAITAGDAVAVERLIDDNPSLATSRRDGVSALRLAAYVGHPELAKPLEARGAHQMPSTPPLSENSTRSGTSSTKNPN